jgi:nitrogen fixation protein NifZ
MSIRPRYEYGEEVRLTRNVRNDGTYPGLEVGAPLARRGSTGFVQNVGTFLQDQIIYSVHFLEHDRVVGCRQEELIPVDEVWVPSVYEYRDKVTTRMILAVNGTILASPGDQGEILKVIRDREDDVYYHVRFPGHTLEVAEKSLAAFESGGD